MGSPWDNLKISPNNLTDPSSASATPAPPSVWDGVMSRISSTGSSDPNAPPNNPYHYLSSLPRQSPVGLEQINDMHPLFAQRFAQFSKEAQTIWPQYQISNGARLDGKGHTTGSLHYSGQAADVVPDWNFKKTPESLAKLQALADKYNLRLLDEWTGDSDPNAHFHLSLPQTLPKGKTPVQQVSGRVRTGSNMEDFARTYAAKQGVDPDLISNLFRAESAWRPDAKSSAGAVGLGQMMPGTAAQYLKARGKTWDDYLNNENLQMMVAVDHFKDLMHYPEINNNPARALVAYNAGPKYVTQFVKNGTVEFKATKNYIANVLGIDTKDVDAAVNNPNFQSAPGVVARKGRQELGDYSQPSTVGNTGITRKDTVTDTTGWGPVPMPQEQEQMARNAKTMLSAAVSFADPFHFFTKPMSEIAPPYKNSPLSSFVTAQDPEQRISQSLLPQVMLRNGVRSDGTVDDSAWAVATMKHSINHSLLYIPGVFSAEMRVPEDYAKWREQYEGRTLGIFNPANWGNGAVMAMGFNDFASNLPILNYMAEGIMAAKFIPSAVKNLLTSAGTATANAGRTAMSGGLSLLAEKLPPALVKAGEWSATHQIEPALGYLAQKGQLGHIITWGTVFGIEGMNKELQNQFQQGKTLEQAMWPAYVAGRNNAMVGAAITAVFPAFGGALAATVRGMFKKGPDMAMYMLGKMREGTGIFGEYGKKAASLADNMWDSPNFPQALKDRLISFAESNAKLMDDNTRGWFANLVRDSTRGIAYMDHAARNHTAHLDVIETNEAALSRFDRDIRGISIGSRQAHAERDAAQKTLDAVTSKMTAMEANPQVLRYRTLADRVDQINAEILAGSSPNPRGGSPIPHTGPDGKPTAYAKTLEAELKAKSTEVSALLSDPEVLHYSGLRTSLSLPDPIKNPRLRLAAAESNPFIVNDAAFVDLQNKLSANRAALNTVQAEAKAALLEGRIPNYQNALTMHLTAGNYGLSAAEKAEHELTVQRLTERAQLASQPLDPATGQPKEGANRVPLLQRELQLQVDASILASAPTRLAAENQVAMLRQASTAMRESMARTSGKKASALKAAIRYIDDFADRLGGATKTVKTKEVVTKDGAPVLGPGGKVKTKVVKTEEMSIPGAIEFIPASLRELMSSANPTASDFLARLLDLKSDAFPNGIPIGALAGSAEKLADAAIDPLLIHTTDSALSQMGAVLMSEDATPAMSAARSVLEGIAAGKVPNANTPQPYNYIERVRDLFSSGTRAFSTLARQMKPFETVDQVFGGSAYFANHMMAYEKAALRVADDVAKDFNKQFGEIFKLRRGEKADPKFTRKLVAAIEGGKDTLIDFLKGSYDVKTPRGNTVKVNGSQLAAPLRTYFDVMTAVERFKQQSPELAAVFRANYFMHTHPRFLTYIQRGGNDVARMSPHAGWEKARKIETIEKAETMANDAMKEITDYSTAQGKPITSWEEYAFGFHGGKGMTAMQQRAAALGVNENIASDLLHNVLLGDAVTDVGDILHTIVHATFRADGARRFMNQLKIMEGPEGLPLLFSIKNKRFESFAEANVRADYRKSGMSQMQEGKYLSLSDVPAFAGYSGGKAIGSWKIHPQAANLINDYLTSPQTTGGMGQVAKAYTGWRSLSLVGPPLNYMTSVMSNYTTLLGYNFSKAFGLIPIGQHLAEDQGGIMMIRALNAGLQPASLLRNATSLHTDMVSAAKQNPLIQQMATERFGLNTPFAKLMAKTGGILDSTLLMPLRFLDGADAFLNSVGLFRALSDAQLGAWAYYTGQTMRANGTKLMEQTGGDYAAALAIAERMSADHVNRLAGVVQHHMQSPAVRTGLQILTLAPQYAGSKWDTLVDSLDSVFKAAGYRSRHAFKISPAVEMQRKKQLGNYLVGTMVANVAFNNMLNIAINGRPTFDNPPGHKFDVEWADGTFASLPMFMMFKPLQKTVEGTVYEGGFQRAVNSFLGQLHPFFNTVVELGTGKDKSGQPLWPPDAATPEAMQAAFNFALHKVVNVGDILAVREGPSTLVEPDEGWFQGLRHMLGSPMTGEEAAMVWLGMTPTKPKPFETEAMQEIEKENAWAKSQLTRNIQSRVELAMRLPYGSPEFKQKLEEIIVFATKEGVPPGSRKMREYWKAYNPEGNYVLTDMDSVMTAIDNAINPTKSAYSRLDARLRPMLHEMIEEHLNNQSRDYLEQHESDVTEADIIQERLRRNQSNYMPTNYIPAHVRMVPIHYGNERLRSKGMQQAEPLPINPVTPTNPVRNSPSLLKRRQR